LVLSFYDQGRRVFPLGNSWTLSKVPVPGSGIGTRSLISLGAALSGLEDTFESVLETLFEQGFVILGFQIKQFSLI
jgi:hypothetical protein